MSDAFHDFLQRLGDARPPQLAYDDACDVPAWQARLREKVRELLGPVPDRVAAEAECVETVEQPDHVRQLLMIPVSAISRVPAYLLLPRDLAPGERRAGVIVLHGHGKHGIDQMAGVRLGDKPDAADRCYALNAVRAGHVVITPCWWGWDQRDGHVELARGQDKCNKIQIAANMYGLNVLALHMQDAAAAIDVLLARPEVDPARVGCLGHSYGGRTTMWLSILDNRIKAVVAGGCMNTFRERSLKLASCGVQYPFGILRYADVPELLSLIAPRPLQLQAGEQDPLINERDREHIRATVGRVYERLGVADRFEYHQQPGGHILDWPAAEQFLQRRLAPGPAAAMQG